MKLLVLCGPTATGKTELALNLAKKFDGELVSADARQIYRGMDIGTGKDLGGGFVVRSSWFVVSIEGKKIKVPQYLINSVPVWMYDVVAPDEEFTAHHYLVLARRVIEDIWARGKLPIVVGGSGFYIDAVTGRIKLSSVGSNTELRKELNSWPLYKLQEELRSKNQEAWEKMNESDRKNPRRLIRKIEIAAINFIRPGRVTTSNVVDKRGLGLATLSNQIFSKTDIFSIGLNAELTDIYTRIDKRVDKRVDEGILKEIHGLLEKGYSWDDPGMNALGYREWKEYFQNLELPPSPRLRGTSRTQNSEPAKKIIQRWKWDEHGYARRQMTWFRKNNNIKWISICEADYATQVEAIVGKWYTTGNES